MGILETTFGHEPVQKALMNALVQDRLPSQFLFVGPEGIGKKRVAWGIAEVLLCQNPPEPGQACGKCPSCLKVQSGFHENILSIEPEKNLIKLEKARDIQDFLSLAQDQGARVILVDDAHALNTQASNSLLKIFEEPPPRTYFFFITHRWTQVLPTIRSRSTKVPFSPLSEQTLSRWTEGAGGSQINAEMVRWARGSVKELINQKQEESSSLRLESFELLQKFLIEKDFLMLGSWRDLMKDKDKLLLFIHYWMLGLREFFWFKNKPISPSSVEASATQNSLLPLMQALNQYPEEALWELWDRGLLLESGLLGHRDPTLLIEEWLLPLLSPKESLL